MHIDAAGVCGVLSIIHAYWRSFGEWIWGRPMVVDERGHGK